jgi:hypothetical protein
MNDLILRTTENGKNQIEPKADLFPISVIKESLTTADKSSAVQSG